jgi:hypothetical protein
VDSPTPPSDSSLFDPTGATTQLTAPPDASTTLMPTDLNTRIIIVQGMVIRGDISLV